MREYENLHPVNEMERISRKELRERFDEVLDKVDKDDIGFVITDDGKKKGYGTMSRKMVFISIG